MFKRLFVPAITAAMLAAVPVFAQPVPDAGAAVVRPEGGKLRERLQRIHDRLGITPAQQPQWEAVVAALRDNARSMRANPAASAVRSGQLDAVQEIHAAADLAQARADALHRMIPPVEALYASLSPEQRHSADQVLEQAMHAGHGRRG